jgi:hypothetical protein
MAISILLDRSLLSTQHCVSSTDPSGRAVWGVGLRPLACWGYGFESRRGHGCLSLVSVVCCQVEVSASGWSLVQRCPTDCGVSECDREASTVRRPWPTRGCCDIGEKIVICSLNRTFNVCWSCVTYFSLNIRCGELVKLQIRSVCKVWRSRAAFPKLWSARCE